MRNNHLKYGRKDYSKQQDTKTGNSKLSQTAKQKFRNDLEGQMKDYAANGGEIDVVESYKDVKPASLPAHKYMS